jgi:hypothetical protein
VTEKLRLVRDEALAGCGVPGYIARETPWLVRLSPEFFDELKGLDPDARQARFEATPFTLWPALPGALLRGALVKGIGRRVEANEYRLQEARPNPRIERSRLR